MFGLGLPPTNDDVQTRSARILVPGLIGLSSVRHGVGICWRSGPLGRQIAFGCWIVFRGEVLELVSCEWILGLSVKRGVG